MSSRAPESPTQPQPPAGRSVNRLAVLIGAVAVALAVIIAYRMFGGMKSEHVAATVATIRLDEAIKAHPSYDELSALRAEETRLTIATRMVPRSKDMVPITDKAPFDDSVWQKNAQDIIAARIELERKKKQLTEEFRKQTEPGYIERRNAIEDEYLNTILNLNLKLDNQRAMHGIRVSEEELAAEREGWLEQMRTVKAERLSRQMALYQAWQEEIRAMVAAAISPEEAAMTDSARGIIAEQKEAAERFKAAVDFRNSEVIDKAVAEQTKATELLKNQMELDRVKREAAKTEQRILNDIRSRSMKLAKAYKLELIISTVQPNLDDYIDSPVKGLGTLNPSQPYHALSINALDITTDLINELKGIKPQ